MAAIGYRRFRDEVVALYRPPLRKKGTFDLIRQVLDEFSPYCKTCRDVAPRSIACWLNDHPDRSAVTSYKLLRSLRTATNYARAQHYLRDDPFAWRSPAKWVSLAGNEDEEEWDRHLSLAQVGAILVQADREAARGSWQSGRLQALVYTLTYTGMRRAEVLGARVADVDLPGRIFAIRTNRRRTLKTPKSGQPLAIAEALAAVLAQWLPRCGCEWFLPGIRLTGPWLSGGPGYRALDHVHELGKRAGIEDLTMLSFRHTFGTLAEAWGFGELELQRWLRHSRKRTQRYYRHPDLDSIQRSAAKIRFGA